MLILFEIWINSHKKTHEAISTNASFKWPLTVTPWFIEYCLSCLTLVVLNWSFALHATYCDLTDSILISLRGFKVSKNERFQIKRAIPSVSIVFYIIACMLAWPIVRTLRLLTFLTTCQVHVVSYRVTGELNIASISLTYTFRMIPIWAVTFNTYILSRASYPIEIVSGIVRPFAPVQGLKITCKFLSIWKIRRWQPGAHIILVKILSVTLITTTMTMTMVITVGGLLYLPLSTQQAKSREM